MMTYLSQYIPHFAEKSHTLRGLIKKETTWTWDIAYQNQVDELKEATTNVVEDPGIQIRHSVPTRRADDSRRCSKQTTKPRK